MPSPVDYSGLLRCTYGTSVLDVWSYTFEKQAGVRDLLGRMVDDVTFVMDCRITCTTGDTGDFAAQITQVADDLEKDGRDFKVLGISGITEAFANAARCENGGPHISNYKMSDGPTSLCKKITFTVKATSLIPTGSLAYTHAYKVNTRTRPDDLDLVVRTGEVHGPDAPGVFQNEIFPLAQSVFPLPNWVVDCDFETGMDGILNGLTYTINARQNFGPLLAVDANKAVDGEVTKKFDRDENQRMLVVVEFDLLVVGDPMKLITLIQSTMPNGALIYKQAYTLTTIKEQRLTGSFTVLQSADLSPLLNWTEALKIRRAVDVFDLKTYPGVGPLLVKANQSISKGTQSGTALAVGKYPKEPDPMPGFVMAEEPDIDFTDMNNVEKKTSWTYVFWFFSSSGQSQGLGGTGAAASVDPLDASYNLVLGFMARDSQANNGYRN